MLTIFAFDDGRIQALREPIGRKSNKFWLLARQMVFVYPVSLHLARNIVYILKHSEVLQTNNLQVWLSQYKIFNFLRLHRS